MDKNPMISVVMSVYNGEKYLTPAIESILNQTYTDFEFIIINDGSNDQSLEIIQKYKEIDNRIKIHNNKINKGLIYSLNKGINLSLGKYIARMDADDISLPNRFFKQVEFMEEHLDITVLGTGILIFKNNLKFMRKKMRLTCEPEELKINSLFQTSLAHPTVFIRKDDLKKSNLKYELEEKGMEDFGLWLGLSKNYKFANLPDILLKYRFLSTSVTSNVLKNINNTKNTSKNMFYERLKSTYIPDITEKEAKIHMELCGASNYFRISQPLIKEKEAWLEKLYLKNSKYNFFEEEKFLKKLHEIYLKNMLIYSDYKSYSNFELIKQIKINKLKFNFKRIQYFCNIIIKIVLRG
ncbi:MAG: glycosyltransferase family 2 protein [Fusobacteriaceae bacterium]